MPPAMLDALLSRHLEPALAPAVARLAALGVSADSLTASGFVLGIAAVPDIGHRAYLTGLAFIVLSRLVGALARLTGTTRFGVYLDKVLDLVWTAAIPFAFALAEPERALAAMFLLMGLVARTAALAAEDDLVAAPAPPVLAGGRNLVGKTEILLAFALGCLLPNWFSIIAYVLGMLCFIMAGFHVAAAVAQRR